MSTAPQVSFIIPLYNEAEVFRELVDRLQAFTASLKVQFEIVLVDDGSSDDTPVMMKSLALTNPHYHCIFLSRNFGHQYAVSAGLRHAEGTEAMMVLDGDLQDPPELFYEFYKFYQEGFDVVYGVRRKRKESAYKKFSYYVFYRILSRISNTPIFQDTGDFSLISRRVVDIINSMPEDSRFLRGMRSWVGFRQKGVPYDRDSRVGGEPKYTLSKLVKLAYDGVFNFSSFPIKFLTFSGAICFSASILYFIVTLVRKIVWGDVPVGFTALLFMIIFFGGIQLLSIGIIGEYVSRIFMQVKQRPLYIVKEVIKNGKVANE
jgi:polyisoprenyl-phosphate glycosyltransferase